LIKETISKKQNFIENKTSSFIELLKWIGIVSMTFDHIGILLLGDNDIFRMIGRLAFPIFGFVLVYNFIYHTKSKVRYIKRIALFSLFFEPIHFLVFQNHYAGLNIFFIYTLAISFLYLYELIQDDKIIDKVKVLFLIVFLMLSIYVSQYTEYNISGVLLTISFYFSLKNKRFIGITLLFLIVLNAPAIKYIISTLLIVPIGYYASKINITVPRSRYFFYLYYPIHILVLGAYAYHW
jgi:hypothetical protein